MGGIARNVVARPVEAKAEPRTRELRPTARLEAPALSRLLSDRAPVVPIEPVEPEPPEVELTSEALAEPAASGAPARLAHTLRRPEPPRPDRHEARTQPMRVVFDDEAIEAAPAREPAPSRRHHWTSAVVPYLAVAVVSLAAVLALLVATL